MDVAEREHHVGTALRRVAIDAVARFEGAQHHLVAARLLGQELLEAFSRLAYPFVGRLRAGAGGNQLALVAQVGARISVYQPPPGDSSTTVMFGLMPKKVRVS